jgi:ABC-type multidrug transport system ATPase subunit
VILSSHILAEVHQVCDHVSIINHGRLLASGSVADVIGDSGLGLRVALEDLDAGATILAREGFVVRREGGALMVVGAPDPAAITRLLAEAHHFVSELTPVRGDLESVFLTLTEDDAADQARLGVPMAS